MSRRRKPAADPFTMEDAQAIIDANRGFRVLKVTDGHDAAGYHVQLCPFDLARFGGQ